MTNISAVMITLNEGKAIERTLQALEWCDEIVVVDSGSTDQTQEICERYGCKFIYRKFDGYGTQKHFAVAQASNDWVLSIDADEVVTPELRQEITALFASGCPHEKGFNVPISLVFMGKLLRFGDVYKIPHLRLFNKKHGQFNANTVHEGIELAGKIGNLRHHMLHYSYESTSDYFTKFNAYTSAGAHELLKKGKKGGKLQVWTRLPITFFKGYFFKGGVLDGYPGFVWALFSAFYPVVKYIKMNELHEKKLQLKSMAESSTFK
jgi:glycosyltransferase involved in cell wall biosynthesis